MEQGLERLRNTSNRQQLKDYLMRAFENNWKMAAWEYASIYTTSIAGKNFIDENGNEIVKVECIFDGE